MWEQEPTDDFRRQLLWYERKRRRELAGALVNLETYLAALRAGNKPLQIGYGFIHPEGRGVVAIDQGRGKGLAETRLYIYPDADAQVLYLLIIGDKNSQPADIKQCHNYLPQLQIKEVRDANEDGTKEGEAGESGAAEEI